MALPRGDENDAAGNLCRAYGLFIFCFAGHPCLPALHEGMQQMDQWSLDEKTNRMKNVGKYRKVRGF